MGELADDFRFMKEQAKKHREKVEQSRFDYVEKRLRQGYNVLAWVGIIIAIFELCLGFVYILMFGI